MKEIFVFFLLNNILRRYYFETSVRVAFSEKDYKCVVSECESQALLIDGLGSNIFTIQTNVSLKITIKEIFFTKSIKVKWVKNL